MPIEHCCPYCGAPIAYDWCEESYTCDPCGKKFGDSLEPDELLCDGFTIADPDA